MNPNPTIPQALSDQLSDLKQAAEKLKARLTPDIKRHVDEHMAAAQEKLARGEELTKEDLKFIGETKRMVATEQFKQIELPKQYGERLKTLSRFELIESPENPVIVGIDGRPYRAPTIEQIAAKITPQKNELIRSQLKEPILLVVPFALSLATIAGRAGRNPHMTFLDQAPVNTSNFDGASLEQSPHHKGEYQILYFPKRFDPKNHGGLTKFEVLAGQEKPQTFPGWQVLMVEGSKHSPLATYNLGATALKKAFDELGLSGLTLEDWLTLHMEGVVRNSPFDPSSSDKGTYNLANYLILTPSSEPNRISDAVPATYWDTRNSYAFLNLYDPVFSNPRFGGRPAIRISD